MRRRRAGTVLVALGPVLAAIAAPAAAADSFAPFPPGKNADLVRKVCTPCHSATLVVERKYDLAAAKKVYRLFVGNPDSDEGKLVVEYLTTALGE